VLSYLVAASITWWLNARFTFRSSGGWLLYILTNAVGAGVNYGVCALALWLVPATKAVPSVAVAVGSGVALLVNFAANRWLVFRATHP
jgi:putative flippase GtrA